MFNTIFSRKSIRKYTGEKISQSDLDKVLQAGMAAGVGRGNYQNILFTVVSDQDLIDEIENNDIQLLGKKTPSFFGAPQFILISVEPVGEELDNTEYASVGCIAQNIHLAVTELGHGACLVWGAIRRVLSNPELLEKFQLPQGHFPCGAVAFGKTEEVFTINSNRHQIDVKYLP